LLGSNSILNSRIIYKSSWQPNMYVGSESQYKWNELLVSFHLYPNKMNTGEPNEL
jgi:hypothetical protein